MSGNQRNSRRKEMWVSHNRVLVGGNKKNVRNPNFDTEETKLLISLWGNPAIQKTLITSHKKFPIITKLSEAMRQYGYHRTPEEINTRLKNLKCLYNRLKKDVECGLRRNPTWKHFDSMDAILTRPIFGYQSNGENQDESSLPDDDPASIILKMEGGEVELDEEDGLRPEDLLQVETTPDEHVQIQDDDDNDDIIIKEEPIDVDEYQEKRSESVGGSNKSAPRTSQMRNLNIEKLPKLIPRSSWLNTTVAREQPPPILHSSQRAITRQNSVICVSAPKTLTSTAISPKGTVTSTTSSTNILNGSSAQSKGKISLVPTNLLLNQQQQQQLHQQQNSGKNFFVPTSITTTSVGQTASVGEHNNSSMPMKVLLVNTMPKPTTHPPSTPINKAEIVPIPFEQSQKNRLLATGKLSQRTQNSTETPRKPRRRIIRRRGVGHTLSIPGMRSLITDLIQTNRQRLELDTQRFQYQKRVIDEFLGLIPILKGIGNQFMMSSSSAGGGSTGHQQPSSTLNCNGHGVAEEESDT